MKIFALAGFLLTLTAGPTVSAQERDRSVTLLNPIAASITSTSSIRSAPTRGAPYHLRLDGDTLAYCDKRGGRAIDLSSSRDVAHADACPSPEQPNSACSQLGVDAEVRSSFSVPDDILDIDGISIPLTGRVHDCAAEGDLMAIATGSSVNLIEVASAKMNTIDRAGGERVVLGSKWVVWSTASRFRWLPRPTR